MSVRAAHDRRKESIRHKYPEEWARIYADRSRVPSIFWVYNFFRKFMDDEFGSLEGVDAYYRAQNIVEKFNEECLNENPAEKAKVYAKIQQTETGETIVAV